MNLSVFGSSTYIFSSLLRPQEANPIPRYEINRFIDWGRGRCSKKPTCERKAVENSVLRERVFLDLSPQEYFDANPRLHIT